MTTPLSSQCSGSAFSASRSLSISTSKPAPLYSATYNEANMNITTHYITLHHTRGHSFTSHTHSLTHSHTHTRHTSSPAFVALDYNSFDTPLALPRHTLYTHTHTQANAVQHVTYATLTSSLVDSYHCVVYLVFFITTRTLQCLVDSPCSHIYKTTHMYLLHHSLTRSHTPHCSTPLLLHYSPFRV
jgi:hypothetical protein